jgi:hypothetical protein
MLLGGTVAVYCENHTERTNALCGQNAEFYNVKASGTHVVYLPLYMRGGLFVFSVNGNKACSFATLCPSKLGECHSGNIIDSYKMCWVRISTRTPVSWPKPSAALHNPSGKLQDSALKWATTASFQIVSNSPFIHRPTTGCLTCIVSVLTASWNTPRKQFLPFSTSLDTHHCM